MPGSRKSIIARLLLWLSRAIYQRRAWFAWPQVLFFVASVLFTVKFLQFLTDRTALVGGEQTYHRLNLAFRKEFPAPDEIVVVVQSEQQEKNRQFVERLAAKLVTKSNLFANLFYKGDLQGLGPKALLFAPEEGLADLAKTLQAYRPMLQRFTKATNLVSLFSLIDTQFRTATRGPSEENEALIKALPALERIVTQASDALARPGNPPSPGVTAFFEGGNEAENRMYITFATNRIFLITVTARSGELTRKAVRRLRELIAETQREVPGLNVGVTGEPVLEVDEMAQSQRDTTLATVVSLGLVALIFIYGYHETGRPLKATLCLLVGLGYTMGYTTATVGHLNILTITFVPILVGLAIDFGVHLISRYEEELRHGHTQFYALEKGIVFTGMGIFTGCFTTAGAFFAMAFTNFRGIQEMGVICGGGMLVCLVPMMTLLPALLLRGRQNVLDHELGPILDRQAALELSRRARIESLWLNRPLLAVCITLVLSGVALVYAPRARFDYNLLAMQSRGLSSVYYQDMLINSSQRSVLWAAAVADSLSEATNLIHAFTNLPSVENVESAVEYLAAEQAGKLSQLRQITNIASGLRFEPVDQQPVDRQSLYLALYALHGYTGLAAGQTATLEPDLHRQLLSLRDAVSALLNAMLVVEPRVVSEKLTIFQQALFTDLRQTFDAIRSQDASGPLRVQDLPRVLRNRFIGVTGKYLLRVYPRKNIWAREAQGEFIRELRGVYPEVTGSPVQLFEYTSLLKVSYQKAAGYSLAAIAILVFVHFRRLSCLVLALVPVLIGFLWLLGFMGLFDIPFNPANIMTLPLIVGIGVTNGIHILNRFAEEEHPSILARSTGKAVFISGLTTIAGFGSLILAQHRGIRSLGLVMSVGVVGCMVVGLTFLPTLLNWLTTMGWRIKKTQRDNAQSTLGREEPRHTTSSL